MEFDKTRKAIRSEDLDNESRRDMMNKFTSAGGQVLNEKALRKEEPSGGGRGGSGGRRGVGVGEEPKMPSQIAREKARAEGEKQAAMRKQMADMEKDATSFFARVGLKLRCRQAGLTPFGANLVMPRFMSKLNLDTKRAIMECNIMGNDLFMTNSATARAIISELDKKSPLYVELIERATDIYDQKELSELVSAYNAAPSVPVPLDAIRAPMFSLLRKLYYLKTFQESYIAAVEMAVGVQQENEKKQSALYSAKKKRIRSEWKTLMNDIYPSLVLLAQRAENKKADPGTPLFESMLGIVDGDRIGKRKVGQTVGKADAEEEVKQPEEKAETEGAEGEGEGETEAEEETKEVEEEPKEEPRSKAYNHGLKLQGLLSIPQFRKKHDPRGEFKDVKDNDKVLISYLFLKEFEREYSFILTTPKIHLEPTYHAGVKRDFHQLMADLYQNIRPCEELFKQYTHENMEYTKALGEAQAHAQGNYVEHAKRAQLMENRRGASGRESRVKIKEFMAKVAGILNELIQDMKGPKKVVTNMEEPITFDQQIEGRRRLNGRKVKECIMEAYCYAHVLADRIEGGDLFGGVIEMSEDEFAKSFASSLPANNAPAAGGQAGGEAAANPVKAEEEHFGLNQEPKE